MFFRKFLVLFLFLFLVFLNDGLSHPQQQNGPTSYISPEGAEFIWVDAEDFSVGEHPTVSSDASANKSVIPLGQKWSLSLSGSVNVTALGTEEEVLIGGESFEAVVLPRGVYFLRAHIKKVNAQGDFETILAGDNDTGWELDYFGLLDRTSTVAGIHICTNKFNLSDYQVDVEGRVTNTLPDPNQSASTSVTL